MESKLLAQLDPMPVPPVTHTVVGRLENRDFADIVDIFVDIINVAIPVVAGLALMVFLWGLVKFIFRIEGDTKSIEEGKKLMVWGLIALFVMVSLEGILLFISGDLGLDMPGIAPFLPE